MKKSLITANEIAERLGIRHQTVYPWIRQKRIPFYRVGRLVKFDEDGVLAHFKAEAEKNEFPENAAGKRIVISRCTIDPRRAADSNATLTPEQRQRYKTLLKIK
jgi:excisionase family DNA binding protein